MTNGVDGRLHPHFNRRSYDVPIRLLALRWRLCEGGPDAAFTTMNYSQYVIRETRPAEPELVLRPINERDWEAYRRLLARLSPEDLRVRFLQVGDPQGYLIRCIHVKPPDLGFVVVHNGQIVASGHAFQGRADVFEFVLVVDPLWRHHGIGGMLLERVTGELTRHGAKELVAHSATTNSLFSTLALEHGMKLVVSAAGINQWRKRVS